MNGLNPPLIWEFHERKHVTYTLRIQNLCKLPSGKRMTFGLDSISFRDNLQFDANYLDNLDDKEFLLLHDVVGPQNRHT